jgi:hypothetical protein
MATQNVRSANVLRVSVTRTRDENVPAVVGVPRTRTPLHSVGACGARLGTDSGADRGR